MCPVTGRSQHQRAPERRKASDYRGLYVLILVISGYSRRWNEKRAVVWQKALAYYSHNM